MSKRIQFTEDEYYYLRYLVDINAGTELDFEKDPQEELDETVKIIKSIRKKLGME